MLIMNTKSNPLLAGALVLALSATAYPTRSLAADLERALVIKNHKFEPVELRVPANQRIRLTVHNQDPTPEEFESHALNREKIVPPGAKAVIFFGPLKPGRYEFFGEYHEASARGVVIAE